MISSEEGIRLAKRVAAEQNCSRREAEALIVAGGVQVGGKVVTDPARRVREEQTVLVNRLVSMAALAPMTLVLFKPAHRVANLAWLQDTVGLKAPQPGLWGPERLAKMQMPLPLAKPASGLCIFTDDVGVLRHLEDRRSPMEQEWMATVSGEVPEGLIKALNGPGIRASINRQTDTLTVLRIAVVTETYPPEINGVAMTVARLVQGLVARGHRLQLVRPRQPMCDAHHILCPAGGAPQPAATGQAQAGSKPRLPSSAAIRGSPRSGWPPSTPLMPFSSRVGMSG